jgi:hypothetical protein
MSLAGSMTIYRTTAWMEHGDQIYLLLGKRTPGAPKQRQAEKTLAFHSPLPKAEIIATVLIRPRFFSQLSKDFSNSHAYRCSERIDGRAMLLVFCSSLASKSQRGFTLVYFPSI